MTGTVTDPGAIIPNASVTIVQPTTGETKTAATNGAGLFDVLGLDAGKYNMTIKVSGFQARSAAFRRTRRTAW